MATEEKEQGERPLTGESLPQVYINQLSKHAGAEVTLRGWLYNLRSSGKLLFLQLRDGTGIVQCVVFKKAVAE
ncbi:MAG TPA: OB-fold nucleic acid binding domain-containing protein, partial [Pyrinomonadaceae bacterium]|nr:OB-fold nucleic acid binding domain-containing protein [Pyrinomonadaceae bacterium]